MSAGGGGWVKMPKWLLGESPKKGDFRPAEAALQALADHAAGKTVTLTGYAEQWGWGKRRVTDFLTRLGLEIRYPEPGGRCKKQRGFLHEIENGLKKERENNNLDDVADYGLKTDYKRTINGLKKERENNNLDDVADYKRTKNGLKTAHYNKDLRTKKNHHHPTLHTQQEEGEHPATYHQAPPSGGGGNNFGQGKRQDPATSMPQEAAEYCALMRDHITTPAHIRDRAAYLAAVERRIRRDGLSETDREQVRGWQAAAQEQARRRRDHEAAEALAREYGVC